MTPMLFLAIVLTLTAIAVIAQHIRRHRHLAQLEDLAQEWKMHFSATDRFRLAPRVAQRLPIPGAAAVRVVDLIYGIDRDRYRYLFAAEYTIGVLRTKTGIRRIGAFSEPRERSATSPPDELIFAPESLAVIEQYRHLRKLTFPAAV